MLTGKFLLFGCMDPWCFLIDDSWDPGVHTSSSSNMHLTFFWVVKFLHIGAQATRTTRNSGPPCGYGLRGHISMID